MRDTTQVDELQLEILTQVTSTSNVVEGGIFPDQAVEQFLS
jgi:hypothetical protein